MLFANLFCIIPTVVEWSSGVLRLSVSVVVPVYRRQRELSFALRSLASEANLIDELIVVDDGSDPPIEIDPPPELAPRTHLIRLSENRGAAAARQVGIDNARSDTVAFLDSDDAWLPGKLAAQLHVLQRSPSLTAVTVGWQVIDLDRGTTSGRLPDASSDPNDFARACWFLPGSTVLLRREDLARVGPLDTALRRLEDTDWYLRFALAGGRLEVVDRIGTLIRRAAKRNRGDIRAAAEALRRRFADAPSGVRRRLASQLELELAFSSWTEGNVLSAVGHMTISLVRVPRRTIHVARFWRPRPLALPMTEACRKLGLDPLI